MKQRTIIIVVTMLIAVALVAGGITIGLFRRERIILKVFHAGSLTMPLEKIKEKFEEDFSSYRPSGSLIAYSVEVWLEPAGSVACVRKITELGKYADVLASADYSLIPDMMIPNYVDWYLMFAKNKMVLTYSSNSMYADEINSDNWYQILNRTDVRWGFSNPNLDPCGYRSLMIVQLSELEYGDDQIFEDLIVAHSAVTMIEEAGAYDVTVPEDLNPDANHLVIRDKSVDLISMVQTGGLDYAFEYLSAAIQHRLNYVELPASVDLSDVAYKDVYKTVKVRLTLKVVTGKPIVYGVTVPKNALQSELGAMFVKYMIDEFGQQVFADMGQPPIVPAVANELEEVPEALRSYSTE